jgi:biotin-dependent carboxylase-like uncharacterized protein
MRRPDVERGLEVVRAGPLTTVQDLGRGGWAHLGVPTSGAADQGSLRLANRLVGNLEGAAALEVTVGGLEVRAVRALTVAVTGAACPILIDGVPSPARTVLPLPAGATLRLGPSTAGVRAYLAVRGGIDAPPVLGSRSSDTLSRLGPAALRDGEMLAVGSEVAAWPVLTIAPGPEPAAGLVRLGLIYGPRSDVLPAEGRRLLLGSTWRVSERSDRIGVRLEGPPLPVLAPARTSSEPVVRGAVQVPPGGQPVLFLADHPVTGGYPVVAVVPDAEVDRAGQLSPGQALRFELRPAPVWDRP